MPSVCLIQQNEVVIKFWPGYAIFYRPHTESASEVIRFACMVPLTLHPGQGEY